MRRMSQRRRTSMPILAGIAMSGLFFAFLWHEGWIPIELGNVETGRLAEGDGDDTDLAPDLGDAIESNPIIFSGQSEPGGDQSFASASGALGAAAPPMPSPKSVDHGWEEPAGSDMPTQFPVAAESAPLPASVSANSGSGAVIQIAGEKPTPPAQPTVSGQSGDFPVSPEIEAIDRLIAQGEHISAHQKLSTIYWNQSDRRAGIEPQLNSMAKSIYFSPQPHYMRPYEIQSGDRLEAIAKFYNVSWEYLAAINRIGNPSRIRAGQKIKVIKGPFSAFVDLSDRELTIHAHGYYVRRYQIGIGQDNSSPIGRFKVLEKVPEPQYTDPEGRVTAGGAAGNPLGHYWIDIGNSFGIHGTIDPNSIGQAASRGCIRLRDRDITEVYNLLTTGSEVVIRR